MYKDSKIFKIDVNDHDLCWMCTYNKNCQLNDKVQCLVSKIYNWIQKVILEHFWMLLMKEKKTNLELKAHPRGIKVFNTVKRHTMP